MSTIGRKAGKSINVLCILGMPWARPKEAVLRRMNLNSDSEISFRLVT